MFDVLGAASSVGRGHPQRSACVLVFVPWLAMPGVAQRELRTITYYRSLDTAHLRLLAGKKKLKSFGRAEKPVGKFLRGMNLSYEQVRVAEQGRIARRAGRCRNWCAGEDTVARLGFGCVGCEAYQFTKDIRKGIAVAPEGCPDMTFRNWNGVRGQTW